MEQVTRADLETARRVVRKLESNIAHSHSPSLFFLAPRIDDRLACGRVLAMIDAELRDMPHEDHTLPRAVRVGHVTFTDTLSQES